MKLQVIVLPILTLCLSLSCQFPSFAQTPDFDAALTLWYDDRLVHDAMTLHLEEVASNQSWAMAKVRPGTGSPSTREVGVYFDQTGKLVKEPGARIYTLVKVFGVIQPLTTLSGTPQLPTDYNWEYEQNMRISPLGREEERYPIFLGGPGGTALFRINETGEGKDKFLPAYLLDEEWVPFVQPALKYVQANKEVFDSDLVHEHREQLQQLLSDPNPFLAIAAARTLGEARELDAAFVQGPLAQAKGLEQSVFTFLLLQQLPRAKRLDLGDDPVTPQKMTEAVGKAIAGETPVENLGQFIDSAKDAETLKAVTIGLTALLDSPQGGIFTEARVEGLLQRVLKRQKALKTNTEADAYLNASPVLMRLRQPSPATPQVQK